MNNLVNEEEKITEESIITEETNIQDKKKKRQRQNGRRLIIIGFVALIFMVATYAWFIGTAAVGVNAFKINISTSDGLAISLDGINFNSNIDITKSSITTDLTATYPNHTNHWVNSDDDAANPGLIPISSSGEMDTTNSVLKLFSKSSISSLTGGYRLVSDRIVNYDEDAVSGSETPEEKDGYVAFDIFIKNSTGSNYYTTYRASDDEAIYLTTSSKVEMSTYDTTLASATSTGLTEGLENSARVAFMQIARTSMQYTSASENAQDLDCSSVPTGSTGAESAAVWLCNRADSTTINTDGFDGQGYTWNIWEPNDSVHTSGSVGHFDRICQIRSGVSTYTGTVCTPVADNTASHNLTQRISTTSYVNTFSVKKAIASTNNVNIYDGLNGYTASTSDGYLNQTDYFTDTEKNEVYANPDSENYRQPFMYLAPNSVTKIRVYIWLEGQDVDNFDVTRANIGLKVNFGFTKDQFDGVNTSTKYTVTIAATGDGSGTVSTGADNTFTFNAGTLSGDDPATLTDIPVGTKVTLTAAASSGSTFRAWTDGNTDNPRTVSVSDNVTYTAIFTTSSGTYVYVNTNDDSWGTVSGSGEYSGTALTLTATANSGYEFQKWSNNSTTNPLSYSPTDSGYITLTAIFKPVDHTISEMDYENESSYGTVSTTGNTIAHGNPVTLKATAANGYRFKEWAYGEPADDLDSDVSDIDDVFKANSRFFHTSGVSPSITNHNYLVSTANPLTIASVTSDMLFVPKFVAVYNVNVSIAAASPSNSGTVSFSNKVVDSGSSVTITATPTSGYQISSWTVNGTVKLVDPEDEDSGNYTGTSLTISNIAATQTVSVLFEAIPSE